MWVSKITKENLANDVIDRLLFEGLNDKGASADCIIVLGSIKAAEYRVPVAAEAFFAGRSEKILLCGGKIRNFSIVCLALPKSGAVCYLEGPHDVEEPPLHHVLIAVQRPVVGVVGMGGDEDIVRPGYSSH